MAQLVSVYCGYLLMWHFQGKHFGKVIISLLLFQELKCLNTFPFLDLFFVD